MSESESDTETRTLTNPVDSLLTTKDDRRASLVVLAGTGIGKMFRINRVETVIGRSSSCDVWLDDSSVSRRHAKLTMTGTDVVLVDLESKNGTRCNGEQVMRPVKLKDGDKIQIGATTVVKFTLQDHLDEKAIETLYSSSIRDGLTGIFNKGFFSESLEKEFAFCSRHQQPLSVLMLDIDHFKEVNDTHGHVAGDYVLTQLAANVMEAVRTEDVFARWGGEEFSLLLRGISEDVAIAVAERIRSRVSSMEMLFEGKPIRISVSIGVATHHEPSSFQSAQDLLKTADEYLYNAKTSGRDRVHARALRDTMVPAEPLV